MPGTASTAVTAAAPAPAFAAPFIFGLLRFHFLPFALGGVFAGAVFCGACFPIGLPCWSSSPPAPILWVPEKGAAEPAPPQFVTNTGIACAALPARFICAVPPFTFRRVCKKDITPAPIFMPPIIIRPRFMLLNTASTRLGSSASLLSISVSFASGAVKLLSAKRTKAVCKFCKLLASVPDIRAALPCIAPCVSPKFISLGYISA